jgi:hypothetical protein
MAASKAHRMAAGVFGRVAGAKKKIIPRPQQP